MALLLVPLAVFRRGILTPLSLVCWTVALSRSGRWGMLVVETIGRIRREHLVKGKSIKEIARELNMSRNTVRKVLRSEETSFSYEREKQPCPKLGRWKAELDFMLAANATKAAPERLTLIRLFEELQALGYDGGYDTVRRLPGAVNR
jgi:transposase-like protein